MQKENVKNEGDRRCTSFRNYKTLTLTILMGGGYKFGTKKV